jgi:hypothetical protein
MEFSDNFKQFVKRPTEEEVKTPPGGVVDMLKDGAREVTGAVNRAKSFIGVGLQEITRPKKEETTPTLSKPKTPDIEGLMERLIHTESRGQHKTKEGTLTASPVGAQGITQVMPKTAKNPGYGIKPVQNDSEEEFIRFGRDYVTKMIDVFGDVEQGVAAYNAGPGKIHNALSKAARTGRDWKEFLPKETQDYIKKVAHEERK